MSQLPMIGVVNRFVPAINHRETAGTQRRIRNVSGSNLRVSETDCLV